MSLFTPTTNLLLRALAPLAVAAFLALASDQAFAQSPSNGAPSDAEEGVVSSDAYSAEVERRAQRLERDLICPVCPAETLEQSFVDIAQDMKVTIRRKLAAGESEAQIKQFFVDRYGERVLASPPTEGFNLVAWVVPPVGIALGAIAVYWIMRFMRSGGSRASGDVTDMDLDQYLSEVDRDLALEGPEPENPRRNAGADAEGDEA